MTFESDRLVTAAQVERIEERVRQADVERAADAFERATGQRPDGSRRLQLGEYRRRPLFEQRDDVTTATCANCGHVAPWGTVDCPQCGVELDPDSVQIANGLPLSAHEGQLRTAAKPKPAHVARLRDALELGSHQATAVALGDIASDAYDDSDDAPDPEEGDDTASASSSRLAAVLGSIGPWAAALVASAAMTADTDTPNAAAIAENAAGDAATQGDTTASLDGIEADGGSQYRLVPGDGACSTCQAAAGTYDLDDDSGLPPIHQNCDSCYIEAVGKEDTA